MSYQIQIQNKLVQQHANIKGNGEINENISFSELIADSGENRISSNNYKQIGQTKDETNIESSHNLMQKPNSLQQEIKLPSHQYPTFQQQSQQHMQFSQRQYIPQQPAPQGFYYKSLLTESEGSIIKEKNNSQEFQSSNYSLNSYQQMIDKQNLLTRSQHVVNELKLKPVQYELYKNLKQMKIKSEIAFFILVSENCMSMEEALSYITTDEQDKHLHFFLPRNNVNDDICEVCLYSKRVHIKNSEDMINIGLAIRQQIRELYQKDRLENVDIKEMIQASEESNNQYRNQQLLQFSSQNFLNPQISPKSLVRKRIITCQICFNQVDESSMLNFNGQNHEICIECFRSYLSEEIMISNVENLKCPHCSQSLTEQIIIDHTTQTLYKKYKYFLRNALINKDPLKRFCPTPNCNQIIELKSKSQKVAICDTCKIIICPLCNRIEHKGISCEELLEKEIEDLTDSRDIQRCNKCKSLVQKVQGCNHMTCSICEYQWCWLCGNTYTQIHMMPLNPFGCPFLQSERFTVKNMQMWKIYILRFFTLIVVLLLLPFAIVFSGPILALYGYFELCHRVRRMATASIPMKILIVFGGLIVFILGFALDPLIVVAIIPFGIYILCVQCREKSRIEAISNQRLRELQQRNDTINVNNQQNQVYIELLN